MLVVDLRREPPAIQVHGTNEKIVDKHGSMWVLARGNAPHSMATHPSVELGLGEHHLQPTKRARRYRGDL